MAKSVTKPAPPEVVVPNISVSITGEPKTGKTTQACSFPGPIKLLSFDLRAKWVVSKMQDKRIDVSNYPLPTVDTLNPTKEQYWAEDFWQQIKKDAYEAIDSGEYKTLVLDPATFLWEIVRSACAEEENRAKLGKARDYGEANIRMRGLFNRAVMGGMNLVAVSYLKDVWVDDKPTGETKLDGWKHILSLSDVLLNTEYRGKKFITTIQRNGFDPSLNFKEFESFTYDDLITLLGV